MLLVDCRLSVIAWCVLVAGTLFWFLPFVFAKWNFKSAEKVDLRARWGMLLELIGYLLLWAGGIRQATPALWLIGVSLCLFLFAGILSIASVRVLGRQLRIDAGLIRDHQLVRTGPYRLIRHPIYSSIVCLMLATGLLITPWLWLLAALAVCLVGTEIRVWVEDALLASRFGDDFQKYKRSTRAYIPFLR